jgi:hypothetical protein
MATLQRFTLLSSGRISAFDQLEVFSTNHVRNSNLAVATVEGGILPGGFHHSNMGCPGVYSQDGEPCQLSRLEQSPPPKPKAWISKEDVLSRKPERVRGEAVYAGYLKPHFGHFLMEGTSRWWWALKENFRGHIIFDSPARQALDLPFVRIFLETLGLTGRTRIASGPLQFDRVFVPEQAFKHRCEVHPEFLRAYRTMLGVLAPPQTPEHGRPIYLSRTGLTRALIVGEHLAEEAFEREGFQIVHPQLLDLREQIRLIRQAPIVAGFIGSAMHNLLFAGAPKSALYLHGNRDRNLSNFVMIDQLLGNDATYVPAARVERRPFAHDGPYLFDADRAFDLLEEAGVLRRKNRPRFSWPSLMEAYIAEWEHQRERRPRPGAAGGRHASQNGTDDI